ncbi:MAG: hypothetical protein AAFV07_13060, partial [Bacteroidota bacterium]
MYYQYKSGTNQLRYVNDNPAYSSYYPNDVDDQFNPGDEDNYAYDLIGNLVRDSLEQIDTIHWSLSGKIFGIERTAGSSRPDLAFRYDAAGNRTVKIVKKG